MAVPHTILCDFLSQRAFPADYFCNRSTRGRALWTTVPTTALARTRSNPSSRNPNLISQQSAASLTSISSTGSRYSMYRRFCVPPAKGIFGHILGGWTFASVNQIQSGIPFMAVTKSIANTPDANLDGDTVSGLDKSHPNCVAVDRVLGVLSTAPTYPASLTISTHR